MKRRIRAIFILMTLCILGINVFQGYWLYNNYRLQQQQFTQLALDALLMSLERQQESDARQLYRGAKPGPILGNTASELTERAGQRRERFIYQRIYSDGKAPDIIFKEGTVGHARKLVVDTTREKVRVNVLAIQNDSTMALPVDTLVNRLSKKIIYHWSDAPFSLSRMDSAYRAELALRKVAADFRLDTMTFFPPARGLSELEGKKYADYPIQLQPFPVNPVNNLFVQASFRNPMPYILQRMAWLLVGSFSLLLLTTGCFLYMLSTILRQKKLSEIKNDFINNMTHELKTPLSTVSAAVEGMLSFGALDDPKKTQLYLNVSKNELQRLSDLVEKVLHMAVEEKQELALQPELVNSTELIREIMAHHQLKAPKPVNFVVESLPENHWIQADRMHLDNSINNLIDNAIKYSNEHVTIRIKSQPEANGWRLSVQDNGIGIPKSYQQAIFGRFFRVPTGDLHQVKGFGLGLAYVRQVMEKHGGYIEVHSEVRQGSEFVLWLPG